jgi:hypothetical protein
LVLTPGRLEGDEEGLLEGDDDGLELGAADTLGREIGEIEGRVQRAETRRDLKKARCSHQADLNAMKRA